MGKSKRGCKVICVVKLKVTQPRAKYETRDFQNLSKRLLRDNWNQKHIGISKWYLVRLSTINIVKFLVRDFFSIQHRPCHKNVVPGKGLNLLFDECVHPCPQGAGRTVHLFLSKGPSTNNATLNRFCPLSNGIPTNIKWKIHTLFTLYFKFLRCFFLNS